MVKAELAELVAGAPMNPGDPETRCQYLEKLLGKHGRNFEVCVYKCSPQRSLDVTIYDIVDHRSSKLLTYYV